MAEPTFRTPLAGWSDRFAALAPAVLVAETPVAQISVQCPSSGASGGT